MEKGREHKINILRVFIFLFPSVYLFVRGKQNRFSFLFYFN